MKKGKIIGYSILGGGVIFLSYVVYKKFKNKKASITELVSVEDFDFGLPKELENQIPKIVAVEEEMRPIIENLSNATNQEEKKKLGLEILEISKGVNTGEGKVALAKWYESRTNSNLATKLKNLTSDIMVPLGRYGAPIPLLDVLQRSFFALDWKNA